MVDPTPHLRQLLAARDFAPDDQNAPAPAHPDLTPPADRIHSSVQDSDTEPSTTTVCTSIPPTMPMIPSSQGRMPRSSGRPRSGPDSATVLSEERRSQIRRAQKTYRLKKAASLQETQQRVALLETKLQSISDSLSDYRAALVSELQDSHPLVTGFDNIFDIAGCDRDQTGTTSQAPTDNVEATRSYDSNPPNTPFGYHNDSPFTTTIETPTTPLRQQPSPTITPSPSTKNHSHAFRECSLSRQLQRYSLEYAFRLFTNTHSPPVEIYRVFRLVPCLRNRSKMYPYFRRLVCADTDNPLEVPTLPFYCIGGAGTHYPARDTAGNPIYPPKMRLPRRILSVGVGVDGAQRRLEACGLDGRWFDCRDVEGFLRERGVQVDGSLFPVVRESDSASPGGGESADYQLQMSLVESLGESVAPSRLDLESFFQRLLRGVVILGRVPGFRECDVVGAFKTSVISS